MKISIVALLFLFSVEGFSQSATGFYFDKDMKPVDKKKASIFGTGIMDSGLYKLTCYYLKRKHPLACVAHFRDSAQSIHEGYYRFFFENGKTGTEGDYHDNKKEGWWIDYDDHGVIIDSVKYENGRVLIRTGFYEIPPNHQKLVMVDDVSNNIFYASLYNGNGDVLSREEVPQDYNGIYINNDTVCSFPGGRTAWLRYISKALMSHIEEFTQADNGTVLLRFVVDTDGKITSVRPLTLKTSRLAIIAFNAIDGGPNWIPAEHDGKKVKTIMVQPVTLEEGGR